jgi:hypothetical protein
MRCQQLTYLINKIVLLAVQQIEWSNLSIKDVPLDRFILLPNICTLFCHIAKVAFFGYLCKDILRESGMKSLFDPTRKKFVECTPEEQVRSHTINALNSVMKIPITHISTERGFKYNGLQYRADIIVFDRELRPLMLVECKAPYVILDGSVIDQAIRYNRVLQVKYIMITNGKHTFLFKYDKERGENIKEARVPNYEIMCINE